jgi:hypothetical protein
VASAPIKRIDGREYAFGRIPPTKSVPLQVQLLKLVGPEIQLLFTQDMDKWKAIFASRDIIAIANALGPIVTGIIQSSDGDQVLKLMEVVFAYTTCEGNDIEPRTIDAVFGDSDPATMWKVFFEGLKVNYSRFFPVSPSGSSPPTTTP